MKRGKENLKNFRLSKIIQTLGEIPDDYKMERKRPIYKKKHYFYSTEKRLKKGLSKLQKAPYRYLQVQYGSTQGYPSTYRVTAIWKKKEMDNFWMHRSPIPKGWWNEEYPDLDDLF